MQLQATMTFMPGISSVLQKCYILYVSYINFVSILDFTPAYEDGTDRVFRNVGIYKSDAGESPKRKHTTLCQLLIFITKSKLYCTR